MRIAFITDIHFHFMWYERFKQFVNHMCDLQPDLLILGGDVGEPLDIYEAGLRLYTDICDHRAVIAGNHDVWHRDHSYNSQTLWETKLQETAEAYDYHWLEKDNLVFDSLGICGTMAWYDYGAKSDELDFSDDEYETLKPMISNDGRYIDWPWTDREMAKLLEKELGQRLDALEKNDDIQDILLVTHVPLFKGLQRSLQDPERAIGDAYYGHIALGERVKLSQKVRMVLSGHVHIERHLIIHRNGLSPLETYTNPADYGKPAGLILNTDTWEVSIVSLT